MTEPELIRITILILSAVGSILWAIYLKLSHDRLAVYALSWLIFVSLFLIIRVFFHIDPITLNYLSLSIHLSGVIMLLVIVVPLLLARRWKL